MRRFSQRNSLVTLSDINITPLLDLAFVLLIIFVITTPILDNTLEVTPPEGGRAAPKLDPRNVRLVEITKAGVYRLDSKEITLDDLETQLVRTFQLNKDMIVSIRADQEAMTKHLYPVIDRCTRNKITRLSLRTEPARRR